MEIARGLIDVLGLGQSIAETALMVFLRIGAALALLPAFGEQSVPQRVKLAVALAFTATVSPAVAPDVRLDVGILSLGAEVISGLAIGAVFRLFLLALQIAGSMIAQATSLSQMAGGVAPDPLPAVGHMLTAAGLALAVLAGLHVKLAEVFILSYKVLPAGEFPGKDDISQWGLAHVAHAFRLAFILAMPFTIAALVYNIALGAINRAMPTLMVAFIGAPALAGAGLVVLAILSPVLLSVWVSAFVDVLQSPFEVPK